MENQSEPSGILNGKKRARTAKEKDLRRESLLDAALELLLESNGQLPTINAIASRAGVAKGTAYLYFKTKEAIYMALLEYQLHDWLNEIRHQLRFVRNDIVDGVVEAIMSFKTKQPNLWTLAALGHQQLEPNIDKKALLNHKTKLAQDYRATARNIVQTAQLTESAVDEAQRTLIQTYAYLLGCWQISHPPVSIKSLLKGPGLSALQPDFSVMAQQGVQQIWSGFFESFSEQPEKSSVLGRWFKK
ncbi:MULTISPECIES: TetR family transcriptional regulator [Gammaproteobacteria]|uniref:TetR family transcriptional regulator n=1 Tax=Gammaproteobacteria TaxID=1236 RepID=UPI000DD00D2B|nr:MULTISPECIES: TetR family transcriptional regulator [Gammaproteobacteria]RTE86661.1 TetR/AcrR family transcriptional regulator [Aliidiomarina sp. B3213]TCZ90786.1 TetR/AcrR family transcriptional regulator [Lysobacter sp. N42]